MLATLKKTFTASAYQQAIFDAVVDPKGGSLIVEAVAGSGKSTTIKQAVLRIVQQAAGRRLSIHIFAFNTVIAKEMKEAIAELAREEGVDLSGVRVSTFHSVGFSAICKRLGKKANEVQTDSGKMRKVLKDMFLEEAKRVALNDVQAGNMAHERYELYGEFCRKLVGLAKGNGFGAIVPADAGDWLGLCQHHDLTLDSLDATEEVAVAYARAALKISNDLAKTGVIDFDDQLYVPLLWRLRLWENDWVLVDEAQDTNPVRRAIAKLALRPGGRLVAVGDRRQAIYGFTGASHDAMDLIKAEFNCRELPLSVSYRCGRAIVELAKTLVPQIEPAENAHPGLVSHLGLKDALARLSNQDAIMCRNTSPLVELAFKLVANGRGCRVLGKEIGTSLVSLVAKQRAKGVDNLMAKLNVWREREVAKHIAEGNEGKAEAVNDRFECVQTIIHNLNETERTIPGLCRKIEGLFGDGSAGVLSLATMHKLKGAEFDRVAIYRPELCPSKFARQDWQRVQEDNLLYVGYTRAKLEFIFVEGE